MESCFRLYGSKCAGISHKITHLTFHLPNDGYKRMLDEKGSNSMMLKYFEHNKNKCDDEKCAYVEFACNYRWSQGEWIKRKYNCKVLARIYACLPKLKERFCLRILLLNVENPISYEDLRTFNNVLYNNFEEACTARGLYNNDSSFKKYFDDVSHVLMPWQLRLSFVTLCVFSNVQSASYLLDEYWELMAEDIDSSNKKEVLMMILEKLFEEYNCNMIDFNIKYKKIDDFIEYDNYMYEIDEDVEEKNEFYVPKLNQEQKIIFEKITTAIEKNENKRIFVEGSAGTGKSFLFKALIEWADKTKYTYKCYTPTGIAALMYRNSNTLHSGFKLSLGNVEEEKSYIKKFSECAESLRKTNFIIIDEISVVTKYTLDVINKKLQEICCNNLEFGGKTIIFGCDFKQLPCVLNKGSMYDVFLVSCKNSKFFENCEKLVLNTNVRHEGNGVFLKYLKTIGMGLYEQKYESKAEILSKYVVNSSVYDIIYSNENVEESKNMENSIVLAFTNKACNDINNKVLLKKY